MAMDEKFSRAGAPAYLVVCTERGHREDPIAIANEIGPRRLDESEVWLFSFGAYGDTRVAVIGNNLDDALEIAAEVLAEIAPGIFHALDLPEGFNDLDDEAQQAAHDEAETDMICTDFGYLAAWEVNMRELGPGPLRTRILDKVRGRVHKQALRDYHDHHPLHRFDHTPRPKISDVDYA